MVNIPPSNPRLPKSGLPLRATKPRLKDWLALWREIDDTLSTKAKAQLKCEAFFLTHSSDLHEINMEWNPKGEEFLWNPALQVPKRTAPGTLVYDYDFRRRELAEFSRLLERSLPYCPIRYSF